jgi:hypothetical protein
MQGIGELVAFEFVEGEMGDLAFEGCCRRGVPEWGQKCR